MDIFTILVFFLLINSGDSEILKVSKHIKLPDSVAVMRPESTITVMVTESDIIVDGRPVATMGDEEEKVKGRAVTILGDHTIPYEILKRVMVTCAKSNFRDLSMAVSRLENAGG